MQILHSFQRSVQKYLEELAYANRYRHSPRTAASVDKSRLLDGMPDKVAKESLEWRGAALTGDYPDLPGGLHYGHVRDLIITKKCKLRRSGRKCDSCMTIR